MDVEAIRAEASRRRAIDNVEPLFYVAFTPELVEGFLTLPLADGGRVEVLDYTELDRGALALYEPVGLLTLRIVEPGPPPPPAPEDRPRVAPKPPRDR